MNQWRPGRNFSQARSFPACLLPSFLSLFCRLAMPTSSGDWRGIKLWIIVCLFLKIPRKGSWKSTLHWVFCAAPLMCQLMSCHSPRTGPGNCFISSEMGRESSVLAPPPPNHPQGIDYWRKTIKFGPGIGSAFKPVRAAGLFLNWKGGEVLIHGWIQSCQHGELGCWMSAWKQIPMAGYKSLGFIITL